MAYTIENNYTGNGSTRIYSFTFPYLEDTDIKVSLNQVATTNFELANATQINFTADASGETSTQAASGAPKNAVAIRVYRDTNIDNLQSEFFSGSAIRAQDLNNDFNQTLYVSQETEKSVEGKWNDSTQTLDSTEAFVDSNDYVMTAAAIDDRIVANIAAPALTNGKIWAGNGSNVGAQVTPSGDVTMANTGAFTIANGAVEHAMLANDSVDGDNIQDDAIDSEHITDGSVDLAHLSANSVDSTKIVDGSIANADINSGAAIAHSKLANVTAGQIIVGNGSNIPTAVAVSGDATLASSGAVTIATGAVEHAMLAADCIDGDNIQDDVLNSEHYAAGSIDHEHLANDVIDGDNIQDDAVAAEHIASNAVVNDSIAAGAAIAHSKLANVTDGQILVGNGSNVPTSVQMSGAATIANTGAVSLVANAVGIAHIGCEQTTISDSDSHIPTSGAVVDYVASVIDPIGGLEVIADDESFPNTIPAAGVVISITDAAGLSVNSSGVSTNGDALDNSTITINGFPSELRGGVGGNADPYVFGSGAGLMVVSTGSSQTYNYHQAMIREADFVQLSDDINDFNNRYRIGTKTADNASSNDDGDLFFDTGTNKMYVYDGAYNSGGSWKEVTSAGDFKILTIKDHDQAVGGSGPTFNDSNEEFDLFDGNSDASITNAAQLIVSLNGVIQKPNTGTFSGSEEGFYLNDTHGIKFCDPPPTGSVLFVTQIGTATTISTPGTGSISNANMFAAGVINAAAVGTGAIEHAKLGADCVDGDNLADDACDSEHYTNGSIDHEHLAGDCIDGDNLADNAVDSEHYTDGSIDNEHLADNAVDLAEMAHGTQGDVLYYGSGGAPARLGAGTNGYYLKTQGGSANPVWAEVSAGVTSDGQENTVAGTNAGDSFSGTNANNNSLYGYDAGTALTTGDDNTFIGHSSGEAINIGGKNTCVGFETLKVSTDLSSCTIIGYKAGVALAGGSNCVYIGAECAATHTGGVENTAVGVLSGSGSAANAGTGRSNASFGWKAGEKLEGGSYNTLLGCASGKAITTGGSNTIVGYYAGRLIDSGEFNVCVGPSSGYDITSGDENVCVGRAAGNNVTGSENTLIGDKAGYDLAAGDNNVCLGHEAGKGQITNDSDLLYIARGPHGSGNAACWIHGASNGDVSNGTNSSSWTTYSDQRLKKNITDNTDGLSIIDNVKVRNFKYKQYNETPEVLYTSSDTIPSGKVVGDVKTAKSWSPVASEDTVNLSDFTNTDNHGQVLVGQGDTTTHVGIIAQELEAVCADCIKVDNHGVKKVNTDELFWHMIVAIKELSAKVKALEAG